MRFTSTHCQQHPESLARNSTFAICFLQRRKVCYVEYSKARNREEHPAQIKLTDQRRGAVTRGRTLALRHGGRVPGIQLVEVQCQIPSLCRLPKPSTPFCLYQKPSLRFLTSSSVAVLSIISCSQQTLLLIKDVNL